MSSAGTAVRWPAPLVASIVLAAVLAWFIFLALDGSEFSGGWLTGPLLEVHAAGTILMTLALPVVFAFPRIAAAMALAGVVCCLPLQLYFVAPGLFPGVSSVPHSFFEFSVLDFCSIVALAGVAWDGISALRMTNAG